MKKVVLLTFCLFFLSSCSTKLVYNFLDFAMNWYLKSYVSLSKDQKSFASERIDEFHRWHRQSQLHRYANYIDSVIDYISDNEVSGEWIHGETDKVQVLLDDSVNYLKPAIITLAAGFSDKQVGQVLESFAKDRKKYRKKYVDVSEKKRRKKQKDELMDSIGPFFGKLSQDQKDMIETWLDQLQPYENLTLKQQEIWAEKLEYALNQRNNREKLAKEIEQIMFYRTDDWDPKLEAILDHNQEISYNLLARLYNSQSAKQRKKTLRKLTSYRNDFLDLANSKQ